MFDDKTFRINRNLKHFIYKPHLAQSVFLSLPRSWAPAGAQWGGTRGQNQEWNTGESRAPELWTVSTSD